MLKVEVVAPHADRVRRLGQREVVHAHQPIDQAQIGDQIDDRRQHRDDPLGARLQGQLDAGVVGHGQRERVQGGRHAALHVGRRHGARWRRWLVGAAACNQRRRQQRQQRDQRHPPPRPTPPRGLRRVPAHTMPLSSPGRVRTLGGSRCRRGEKNDPAGAAGSHSAKPFLEGSCSVRDDAGVRAPPPAASRRRGYRCGTAPDFDRLPPRRPSDCAVSLSAGTAAGQGLASARQTDTRSTRSRMTGRSSSAIAAYCA